MTSRAKAHKNKSPPVEVLQKDLSGVYTFKLPDSLSVSDVDLPIIKKPNLRKGGWKKIEAEHHEWVQELQEYEDEKSGTTRKESLFLNTEAKYIVDDIFGMVLPALEQTLKKAKIWNVFNRPKCFFNGIDHLAQVLWNNNPQYPYRHDKNLHIFNIPWAMEHLRKHPRPLYPKSWLWTEEYAATVIQRYFRKYLVQKDPEVHEMRDFWRKLNAETQLTTELSTNPILLKKFASVQSKIVSFPMITHKKLDTQSPSK